MTPEEREAAWERMIETGRRIGNNEGRWELFSEFLKAEGVSRGAKAIFADWWWNCEADRLRVITNPATFNQTGKPL